MGSSVVRAIFEKTTDAFNDHDIDAFSEMMTDDVSLTAPGNMHLQGKDAVSAFYRGWIEAFPDARVEISDVHVLDDVAIEEGVFTGTHRAVLHTPGGDIPATGRSARVEYMQTLRFRGDRIGSYHLVFDRMALLEQLGVVGSASPAETDEERRDREMVYAPPPQ